MQHRIFQVLIIFLAPLIQALLTASACQELLIPVPVNVPRYNINVTVKDDWDAAAVTSNLTRRDAGNITSPLPITGMTKEPVASEFIVGATYCGNGSTVLILSHGIIESKLYWHPNLKGAEKYSFVDAALKAGYSVLSYDRIGVGSSSEQVCLARIATNLLIGAVRIDGLKDAQFQVQTAVLDYITTHVRQNMGAHKVALVGHSYGAYLSAASANHSNVDSVVLTGFSGFFDHFAPFVAGAGLRVAKMHDPHRWGSLNSTFLTSSDLFAETYVYFKEPYFEHRIAKWTHEVASEPFAVGELISLLASYNNFHNITAPVLVLQGQYDVSACGGNCVGFVEKDKLRQHVFRGARSIGVVNNLLAGHNLNLHKVAPDAFKIVFEFLKSQGV